MKKQSDERCPECGEPVPIGAWPYCKSRRNPEGHAKGAYRFSMTSGMVQHKWQRMGR
jgi:hypothetical protein